MPSGSMRKYFADKGGPQHGGLLHWPGTQDGFPYRGATVPDLKSSEDIPLGMDYHARLFRLWISTDFEEFQIVMDRCCNGWYRQMKRIDKWSDQDTGLLVWLEWVQIYGETPNGKFPEHRTSS